jgi:hypothetical protein
VTIAIGETLITGTTAYSPWFERCGDAATFACEVSALSTNIQLTITLQTKNRIDIDSDAKDLDSWIVIKSGVTQERVAGLYELVRFNYAVTTAPTPPDGGMIHFRMLPPAWEDNLHGNGGGDDGN